ncbi:hypothetical protein HZA85_01855 [Candidatus Uhrbacteria bacterium]|nr:hypothetical protein [Candidatus Uhrbacteria bacterium]
MTVHALKNQSWTLVILLAFSSFLLLAGAHCGLFETQHEHGSFCPVEHISAPLPLSSNQLGMVTSVQMNISLIVMTLVVVLLPLVNILRPSVSFLIKQWRLRRRGGPLGDQFLPYLFATHGF